MLISRTFDLSARHARFSKTYLLWSRAFSASQGRLQVSQPDFATDTRDRRSLAERMSLKGRTTVITGGGRGIGLAIAEAAAEAGSNIALLDVLDKPQRDILNLGVEGRYYR